MSKFEKIENAVVEGYKKIEDGVVEGYKKIEDGVVEGFKKVDNGRIEKMGEDAKDAYKVTESIVVDNYKKFEGAVVGSFVKMTDGFVEKHLMKEGETLEEAKERLSKVNSHANVNVEVPTYNHEEAMKAQKEMIEKSIEASKNAGKR